MESNKIMEQLEGTYCRFRSVMPKALSGYVTEHMNLDEELVEDEENIINVHTYITLQLIDLLWDTMGDSIGEISDITKSEFNLGSYRPSEVDKEFSFKESEFRERDNEGL